ncbi:MAG: leucyl/phenylalanyl-tRNA--protein transferase [Flavobacteriales bacterium]|nr:leucyl/phenylalanyl-tRNA--protein transferase [Flavobacteriales bacterium]
MRIAYLSLDDDFPPVSQARADGLLAIGGDVSVEMLLKAYPMGIFPWYNEEQPVLWWAPHERCVLFPAMMHCGKNLRRTIRQKRFEIRMDTAFAQVVEGCARIGSNRQQGTWINPTLKESLCELHEMGLAHSVEAWMDDSLVGGLYGVSLGGMFFGESMFAQVSDASKVCLYHLCQWMIQHDMDLIDCQIPNDHLFRLGAQVLQPDEFYPFLEESVEKETLEGPWVYDSQ